jgi:hypothetical protein
MMGYRASRIAVALIAAFGITPLAAAHGAMRSAQPALSPSQMQALSSEGPTWHANDDSVYDPNVRDNATAQLPARDHIILPDDATNTATPAESSRITGHVDSAAGPPRTGSDEQAGNMGPNSSKGQ